MKQKYNVEGMTCSACCAHVDKAVRKLDGVLYCNVNLLSNTMEVEFDENKLSISDIEKAVKDAGYKAYTNVTKQSKKKDTALIKLIICFISLIVLMYITMGHMIGLKLPSFLDGTNNALKYAAVQLILIIPILLIYNHFFVSGYKKLFKLAPNMDSLIAIGATASIIYGLFAMIRMYQGLSNGDAVLVDEYRHNLYFESAGMILTLVSFGKYLESLSKKKTTNAITKLIGLAPKTARVLRNNEEVIIEAKDVLVGDIVIVKKGDLVPVDGKVIEGSASIEEANITGESMPVLKSKKDEVYSSTVCVAGFLKIKALKVGEDTSISNIIKLVEEASNSKAPISKLVDKIAGVFVPVIMSIALVTLIISYFILTDFELSFNFAISVLVIACPCALGLATPVAIMVGTGKGAENGLLIKNAEILEKAHLVKTVVLDKTGTITEGKPRVTDYIIIDKTVDVLAVAYTLEIMSEHPLASAICDFARQKYSDIFDCDTYKQIDGFGISGIIDNNEYYIGNDKIFEKYGISDYDLNHQINLLSKEGKTVLVVTKNKEVVGLFAIKDPIKPTSKSAVKALKDKGIKVVMLTGDNIDTANTIASEVGIDNVIAGVLPTTKQTVIKEEMSQSDGLVAMVGDGVNDALALTTADLGIAIGGGSDVALESSDIVLLRNDLLDVLNVINLSKRVLNTIKGNLFWAFFYNCIGIILASGLLYGLGIKLNPMIGSLAMSCSSVFVVCNALTINFFKVEKVDKELLDIKLDIHTITLNVKGMMCEHCVKHVKDACEKVSGVSSATPSLDDNNVVIEYVGKLNLELVIENITKAGYEVTK